MKLAEQAAFIARGAQQLRRGHVVGCQLGVGQVVFADGLVNVGAQRIAPDKHRGTAGRTFGHGPGVAEAQARLGYGVDVRHVRRRGTAIAEGRHLVDPDVVHDHEQNVGPLRRRPGGRAAAAGQLQRRDDEQEKDPESANQHVSPRAQTVQTIGFRAQCNKAANHGCEPPRTGAPRWPRAKVKRRTRRSLHPRTHKAATSPRLQGCEAPARCRRSSPTMRSSTSSGVSMIRRRATDRATTSGRNTARSSFITMRRRR